MTMFTCILFMSLLSIYQCRIPDKVYCVNLQCSEPISKAKTLLPYTSADSDSISFRANTEALIYMKSAGTEKDLWYASINGQLGFVSSTFLREYKVLQKTSQLQIIPIDPSRLKPPVQPDKVQQAHEVFEGTTIFTTESNANSPTTETFTEAPASSNNDNVTPSLNDAIQQPAPVSENVNEYEPNEIEVPETNQNIPESTTPPPQGSTTNNEEASGIFNPDVQSLPVNPVPVENHVQIETVSASPQVPHHYIPAIPAPDITVSSSSGDDQTINNLEVPETLNNLQTIEQPEETETFENISNVDKPPLETLPDANVVPDDSASKNLENHESIHNPVSNSDNIILEDLKTKENVNGVNLPPVQPQESQPPPPSLESADEPKPASPIISESTNPSENSNYFGISNNLFQYSSTESPELKEESAENIDEYSGGQPVKSHQDSIYLTADSTSAPQVDTSTEQTSYPASEPTSLGDSSFETTESSVEQTNEVTESPSDNSQLSTQEFIEDIFSSTTDSPASQEENGQGVFSNIYSTVSELSDLWPSSTEKPITDKLFNSDDKSVSDDVDEGFSFVKFITSFMEPREQSKAIFASGGESCFSEDYCDGTSNDRSNRLLTFLLTTATSVLLFTLGYYYIDNKRQDGRLIGTINSLQRDLLFTTKECEILKEELATTKSKLAGIEDSSFGMDEMVQSLKEEIEELKAQNERLRRSLDDNEKLLRVSENTAGELQNTLSEVENTLSELLTERANTDEHIAELNGKMQAFEEELISVSRDRDNYQLKFVSAETALEEAKKQRKQFDDMTQKLSEANNTIDLQKHEITALKDAIYELKNGLSPNVDVGSLIDHTEIKAKLAKALEEKQSFEKKFEVEYKERKRLSEELQGNQEMLQTTSQQATEALTRLEVLGKYFQERETELMKELSAKESLWLSKKGESASTVEKIELLQQEVQRHKEKCDALALELAEQESMRRSAVGEVEARAHAAWLEARAARREADAARDEAATLRRKLAAVAADGAASPHHKVVSPLEATDGVPPPLPPMAFLPPPLLPPLPRSVPPLLPPLPRPPPLGRLPSPHPPRYGDRRYSPDSRYSPESRYSPQSRYSPETVRYSPDSRYSPHARRSPYSPRSRRRSRERYNDGRGSRSRNGPAETETEYNSDSPSRDPRRRRRYSRQSGPSSGSGCSSESDK